MRRFDDVRSPSRSSGETYISPGSQLDRVLEISPIALGCSFGSATTRDAPFGPDRSTRTISRPPFSRPIMRSAHRPGWLRVQPESALRSVRAMFFRRGHRRDRCRRPDARGSTRSTRPRIESRDIAARPGARRIRDPRRRAANASRCDRERAAAAPAQGCDSSAIRPRIPRSQPARPSRWPVWP